MYERLVVKESNDVSLLANKIIAEGETMLEQYLSVLCKFISSFLNVLRLNRIII